MNGLKQAQLKKDLLAFHFGRYQAEWAGHDYPDDRDIFVWMYEQLVEALDSMRRVDNAFAWAAFTEKMKEQERAMCEIVKRITGSYPVYGANTVYDPSKI